MAAVKPALQVSTQVVASDVSCGLTVNVNDNIHNISLSSRGLINSQIQSLKLMESRSPGISSTKDASPSSPKDWKASLESLSEGLSRICGKSAGSMSPRVSMRSPLASQSVDVPLGHTRPVSGDMVHGSPGTGDSPLARCTSSTTNEIQSGANRIIRVRHEETELSLKQSLTAICGDAGSGNTRAAPVEHSNEDHYGRERISAKDMANISMTRSRGAMLSRRSGNEAMKKSTQLQIKESLKSGVRLKLDVESLGGVENVVVCASSQERCVRVFSCGGGGGGSSPRTSLIPELPSIDEAEKSGDGKEEERKKNELNKMDDKELKQEDKSSHCVFFIGEGDQEPEVNKEGRMKQVSAGSISDSCMVSTLTATVVGSTLYVRERPKAALLHYVTAGSPTTEIKTQSFCNTSECQNGSVIQITGSTSQGSCISPLGPNSSNQPVCVPLIFEDEPLMKFTIVLHVSADYYKRPSGPGFGLMIQTVDDSLVIKGQGVPDAGFNGVVEDLALLDQVARSRFSIAMKLPEGSDTRSVSAELSPIGQLIIRGRLSPTSRRMTCDF